MASRDDCSVQPCDTILYPLLATPIKGHMPWVWWGNYYSGMCWYSSFVCSLRNLRTVEHRRIIYIYGAFYEFKPSWGWYGVILRAMSSMIDLTNWRQCALFWTAVIFCAYTCTSMYALSIWYETSVSVRPMTWLIKAWMTMGFVRFTDLCMQLLMRCWAIECCWMKHRALWWKQALSPKR